MLFFVKRKPVLLQWKRPANETCLNQSLVLGLLLFWKHKSGRNVAGKCGSSLELLFISLQKNLWSWGYFSQAIVCFSLSRHHSFCLHFMHLLTTLQFWQQIFAEYAFTAQSLGLLFRI